MKTLTMAVSVGVGLLLMGASTGHAADLVLVNAGQPPAVVVTADTPSPVADYAAKELAKYIRKATGAEIQIVAESNAPKNKVNIFVGATKAAEKAGLTQDQFKGEDYAVKTIGGNLYILGQENDKHILVDLETTKSMPWKTYRPIMIRNGFVKGTRRGTLYGVYDFLDRFLGVKWIWPGELGTYVSKQKTLAVNDNLDIKNGPAFKYRKYRIGRTINAIRRGKYKGYGEAATTLAFSKDGLNNYSDNLREYLLVHQAGETEPQYRLGHKFEGWWLRYGKKHPEWFTMHDDGTRGPYEKPVQTRICVSNPKLAKFVVEKWDGGEILSLGEADHRGFCRCAKCKEWDKPQPKGLRGYSTANRYVRFAQKVHELAVKRNPNVKIGMFMYMDYTHGPTIDANLSWMYGFFCPWGSGYDSYYPTSNAMAKKLQESWLAWGKTGMEMTYRPNYLLSGYTLPALDLKQTGEMIKLAAKNGMMGFDYDNLRGEWATKGPMLYMHMRLGANPDLSIDDITKEYYSAFGPAAQDVEKYFDYWINYTKTLPNGGVPYNDAFGAATLYPPKVFTPAETLLNDAEAKAKVSKNPEFAERVKFLQDGLRHGKLSTEFARLYKANEFEKAHRKLLELIAFRHKHENDFIADFAAASWTENRTYRKDLDNFLKGKFTNFSDPGFQAKSDVCRNLFNKKSVHEIKNLRPGRWGLELPKGTNSGFVTFKYETQAENSFLEASLEPQVSTGGSGNSLDISYDGTNYQTIMKKIVGKKLDLTKYVKGKRLFYLRVNIVRESAPEKNLMNVLKFKVSYTKKYPNKKPTRPKLDIGTGWLDFEGTWYYKKDFKDVGLSAKEMKPETFSPQGWTEVEVPARLAATAVGPYLGYGWYAVEVDIPKDWAARDVEFLIGAVDEQAWVYLNGKKIGEHSTESEGVGIGVLWDEPFIVRATANDLKAGSKNLLMVKTHASKAEHGIWKPVKIRPIDAPAL